MTRGLFRRAIAAWLIAIVLPPAASAQGHDGAVSRDEFATDAGVDDCNVFQLAFGRDGVLWVASADGLLRYDGFHWQHFGIDSGLPSRLVRTVCVTRSGQLWVGTDAGAGTFDGGRFDPVDTVGNLPGPSVRRIVEDPDGSLWFCCDLWPDAGVTSGLGVRRDEGWRTYTVEDGLPTNYVSDFVITSNGNRFALTRNGLGELRGDRFGLPLIDAGLDRADVYIWSLVEGPDGDLLATGDGVLFQRRGDAWSQREMLVPGARESRQVKLWRLADGTVVSYSSGREDRVLRWNGDTLEPWSDALAGSNEVVEDLIEGADGSLWCCGVRFVTRWQPRAPEWSLLTGFGAPQLCDPAGRVWLGDGDASSFWENGTLSARVGPGEPLILCRRGVLGRGEAGLAAWSDGRLQPLPLLEIGVSTATHWVAGPRGWPWVAGLDAAGQPVIRRESETGWATVGDLPRGFGIVSFNRSDDRVVAVLRRSDELLAFAAGDAAPELMPLPPSPPSAPTPSLLWDREDVWLLGNRTLRRRTASGDWSPLTVLRGDTVTAGFRNGSGLWFAGAGTTGGAAGLAHHDGTEWRVVDLPGTSVVGVDEAGTRYLAGDAATLTIIPTDSPPRVVDLPLRELAQRVVCGTEGELWIQTSRGILLWRPDGTPPETVIVDAPTGLGERDAVSLRIEARRWQRPRADNGRVQVSHRVNGGDWSAFAAIGDGRIDCGTLPPRVHRIEVRVRDEAGVIDPTPAAATIEVYATPLQQLWWFWLMIALGLGAMGWLGGATIRSSALRRALKARLQAEQRYRGLVQHSPLGILELDPNGDIASINEAGAEMLGPEQPDVLPGRSLIDFVAGERADGLRDAIAAARQGERVKLEFSTAAGRQIAATLQPLRDDAGAVTRITVNLQDITQERRIEAQLRHGQRMESIGRLAGGVAHDFNNLLTAVLGNAEILRARLGHDGGRDASELALLGEIETAGRKAADLTRQLLTFARKGTAETVVVDAAATLRELEPLLFRILCVDIRLHLEGPAPMPVRLESGQFEQIVINLAANAADAAPDGDGVTIRLACEHLAEPDGDANGVLPSGDYVVLRVQDQGAGIAPEVLPRIFEPFFTTKDVGDGTGLGLATVYGIAHAAGGRIDIATQPGAGTEFRVWLPKAASPAPKAAPPKPATTPGSETVLVCDDQPAVRSIVVKALRSRGYQVLEAQGAAEALAIAAAHTDAIHLLLTDLTMPGTDGRQLARRFAEHWPKARIMFMTGYDTEGVGAEPAVVLSKPFTSQELFDRVRRVLDGR